jgi:hypothetical protein
VTIPAILFSGIPLTPQAVATGPRDVAVQADDSHIPEIDHFPLSTDEMPSTSFDNLTINKPKQNPCQIFLEKIIL